MENRQFILRQKKGIFCHFHVVQIIRTKSSEILSSTFEQFVQALAYKVQMHDTDALLRDAFGSSVNEDYVKLEYSNMILILAWRLVSAGTVNIFG